MPTKKIRIGWLKCMYIVTVIVAGGCGLAVLFIPEGAQWMFDCTSPRVVSGIVGSVYIAFGLLSILGLRSPVKFAPILLLQMVYKTIWLIGVAVPLLVNGALSLGMIPLVAVFLLIVVGDIIAIPFRELFRRSSHEEV